MNIKQAKQQVKNTVLAYLTRDEYGNYEIPAEAQRPVFLVGAPGIGKTAILRQVAQELGIGLVSYSMTHHTRQSALGLPVIRQREYGQVSEYTMSEIIAAVYDCMEQTGMEQGILFLDEINCVSETLAPSMLQFLQFKTFGRHRVPEGWVVVTAGNPPAYNRSVREFDVVTLDRLKKITVEPDLTVWKEYAAARQMHPAVLSYLEIHPDHFYRVESTADGKRFVTARGWEDLSRMLRLYEKRGLPVDGDLTAQYLQYDRISTGFAAYYELFRRYQADYAVEDILAGRFDRTVLERAAAARFDERYALVGLLLDALAAGMRPVLIRRAGLERVLEALKAVKQGAALAGQRAALARQMDTAILAGNLTGIDRDTIQWAMRWMEAGPDGEFAVLRERFAADTAALKDDAAWQRQRLESLFRFCEQAFPEGQEQLIVVTELTVNPVTAEFIRRYGSDAYFAHSRDLLFEERGRELDQKIGELSLD